MNKRKIGADYEEIAAGYLESKGYRILERNYRCRYGEVDIIAVRDGMLVIVEVKYRSSTGCGEPAEAVDVRKQRRICRVTMDYLMRHQYFYGKPCRFDVISICGDNHPEHMENVFCFHGS
nr:YraN family protein [Lachnospiraceae bacterium]